MATRCLACDLITEPDAGADASAGEANLNFTKSKFISI